MSHTVQVNLTANQCIYIGGVEVNIHEINTIFVSEEGVIEGYTRKPQEQIDAELENWLQRNIPTKKAEPPKPHGLWRRGM